MVSKSLRKTCLALQKHLNKLPRNLSPPIFNDDHSIVGYLNDAGVAGVVISGMHEKRFNARAARRRARCSNSGLLED